MRVSTQITERGGTIEISLSGGIAARLFGAPFLLVGAYFAYYLVLGVVDLVTGRAALGEMFFGTVILVVMTAAFLVPGWLLVASRGRIEIDRASRRVVSIRDLRVYQHRQERSLDEFTAITVDRLGSSRTKPSSVRSWQVELTSPSRTNQVIGLIDDDEEAVAFARRISLATGLPVDDARDRERVSDEDSDEEAETADAEDTNR